MRIKQHHSEISCKACLNNLANRFAIGNGGFTEVYMKNIYIHRVPGEKLGHVKEHSSSKYHRATFV